MTLLKIFSLAHLFSYNNIYLLNTFTIFFAGIEFNEEAATKTFSDETNVAQETINSVQEPGELNTPEILDPNQEMVPNWIDALNFQSNNDFPSSDNILSQNNIDIPNFLKLEYNTSDICNNLLNNNTTLQIDKTDLLKNLAADAGICKCQDCGCTSQSNCTNCSSDENKIINEVPNNSSTYLDLSELNSTTKIEDEQCCILVCLKTLKQAQQVFALTNCCVKGQNLNLSCLKTNVCNTIFKSS